MDKKPKSFDFYNKTYKAQYKWPINQTQKPVRQIFACSKRNSQKSFVLTKHEALSVCEDFQNSSTLSDVTTGQMQALSIDYSNSAEPTVACSFSTGHILIMDPLRRKRGPVKWLNTKKKLYSSKPPLFLKWMTNNSFVVLFGDNLMWEFNKTLNEEDTEFPKSAQIAIKNVTGSVIGVQNPELRANPTKFWKFSIGRISEIQVNPIPDKHSLAALTDNTIKVLNLALNTHTATLFSYFANFYCISWSPDGEMLLAGGEDDCIHAWRTTSWQLLFRGIGHNSWVSSIFCEFTDFQYIITSVGHDGQLLIWEQNHFDPFNPSENSHSQSTPVITQYPQKHSQTLIEPSVSVLVSQEPLEQVVVYSNSIFVLDSQGTLNMWINING